MIIAIIQNVPLYLTIQSGQEVVDFTADADVDCDGLGGNPHHDPYFQPDTKLHHNGKALIAEEVPYIVVPPSVIKKTKGIVMGCRAQVTLLDTQQTIMAVVGDEGPTAKVGEMSVAACERLGLNGNPNNGGISYYGIHYRIFPGIPATVDGVTYELQPN